MSKTPKFIVIHGQANGFLCRFTIGYFTDCQDDPSCWSENRADAHKYTLAQIDKMRSLLEGFQGSFTVEAA